MKFNKILVAGLLGATVALTGCAYDDYGYGGMSVGYGYPGYYDAWGPYDYAPFGWYDGYYYPGSGYWMYNREGRRFRWSDRQRDYWEHRRDRGEWHGPRERPWQPGMRDDHQWRGRQWGGCRRHHRHGHAANPVGPGYQPAFQRAAVARPSLPGLLGSAHRRWPPPWSPRLPAAGRVPRSLSGWRCRTWSDRQGWGRCRRPLF